MGNRRHITKEVKQLVVVMSMYLRSRQIAEITGISRRTVNRVLGLYRTTGSVVRVPLQPGRPRVLNSLHVAYLESLIERTPDLYLSELQEQLEDAYGISVSEYTITTSLKRAGFSRKKMTRPALERNEELRAQYQAFVGENYTPEQLVFVDESACNRNTTKRAYGWSPDGTRARRRDYFVRGQRYSILPALSLDGILHLDIISRSYTAQLFNEFIDGLLDNMNPFPAPNSVVVMDNASIHKSQELREMIEGRGMRLLFLPPYSPDLNPIEEAFSSIKAWIRANRDYARVFEAATPENARGWFEDCSYF
ncbi:hypothetical protein EST38_g13170 [Candolleomyces aberdarensis]|uniref:Transposase n=1 Tax=Candolleomyces aberdarensis TaxID=2316362 RepID=A0A4Q2D0K9_9AGAR|nr:hypothetical protein EST38_g13170 [Candolleomyces aberdarensis]